jgi:hypothetical protein
MDGDHDHIPEVLQLATKLFRKLLEFSLYFLKLSQELQFLQGCTQMISLWDAQELFNLDTKQC